MSILHLVTESIKVAKAQLVGEAYHVSVILCLIGFHLAFLCMFVGKVNCARTTLVLWPDHVRLPLRNGPVSQVKSSS